MPRPRRPRAIRVDGEVAYVDVGNGMEAAIDADDLALVSGYPWRATDYGGGRVRVQASPYFGGGKQGRRQPTVHLARLIAGAQARETVDFANDIPLNCNHP